MGVGGLMTGGKTEKKVEYVDADVAYLVPSFFDHAYLLADGASYALDPLTEKVAGGHGLKKEFALPKQGDAKKVRFVYLVPESAKNLAFQFFDLFLRPYPHPARGRPEARRRRRRGRRPRDWARSRTNTWSSPRPPSTSSPLTRTRKRPPAGATPWSSSTARACPRATSSRSSRRSTSGWPRRPVTSITAPAARRPTRASSASPPNSPRTRRSPSSCPRPRRSSAWGCGSRTGSTPWPSTPRRPPGRRPSRRPCTRTAGRSRSCSSAPAARRDWSSSTWASARSSRAAPRSRPTRNSS